MKASLRGRTNELTSLMLVFPLFLVYQIGVLAIPEVYNGADLITSELLHLLHGRLGAYILLNVGLGIAFLVALLVLRRRNEFQARQFIRVILESAFYAVTMGTFIVFVMTNVLHIDPRLRIAVPLAAGPHDVGMFGRIILSFGAGVHEELVFRLLMIPALIYLAQKLFGFGRAWSIVFAFLVSSVLFSLAHHVIGGEPFHVGVFVYRTLCGLVFATIYQFRGFATGVYTHALYDIFVLTLHG
jgi:membrane protease YdiL (CAAX protease family)